MNDPKKTCFWILCWNELSISVKLKVVDIIKMIDFANTNLFAEQSINHPTTRDSDSSRKASVLHNLGKLSSPIFLKRTNAW